MPETTPLIKAALNLRVGAGFDVYHHPVFTILSFLLSVRKFYGFHQCILQHTCRTVIAIWLNFLQQCIQIHQGSALDLHALVTV